MYPNKVLNTLASWWFLVGKIASVCMVVLIHNEIPDCMTRASNQNCARSSMWCTCRAPSSNDSNSKYPPDTPVILAWYWIYQFSAQSPVGNGCEGSCKKNGSKIPHTHIYIYIYIHTHSFWLLQEQVFHLHCLFGSNFNTSVANMIFLDILTSYPISMRTCNMIQCSEDRIIIYIWWDYLDTCCIPVFHHIPK